MAKCPPVYSDRESAILIAVYEHPEISYDTFSLTQLLDPSISVGAAEHEGAFKETLKAIERLIVKGLIDGNQLKGGLGMYYNELKLKYKGKQAAIQERDRVAELNKKLPEWVKESNAVIEEIRKAQEKK